MKVYAKTDTGRVRELNEDSFYLPQPGESFCAVADGMGGHAAGEVASALAISVFSEAMRDAKKLSGAAMRRAVERANRRVFMAAAEKTEQTGMGTTFTALCGTDHNAVIAHVGDSRAYLVRNRAIMQLTTDHTLVEELVENGVITVLEARVHPKRNYITRALGTEAAVKVDILNIETQSGDLFLLCSDGLSGLVEDWEMLGTVCKREDPDDMLTDLINLALQRGGRDNVTCLIAVFDEEDA